MAAYLFAVFVFLLCVALAVAGLVLAQRRVPLELRQAHNTTLGILYGTLHVTFGVMVGFSAFLVLDKYSATQHAVADEAGDVVQIYQMAEGYPEPPRDQIRELAMSYARVVVDEEWPLLGEGQHSSRAEALAPELRRPIQGFEPTTESEKAVHARLLERVDELNENREIRLLNSREGLPHILWGVLVLLAGIMVFSTFFLGMESARLHRFAVATLAGVLALIMFTIVALDNPFGELFGVGPDAFELAQDAIEASEENQGAS
jgi:uncharacterized membrane protein HdeD (DUF308 family)